MKKLFGEKQHPEQIARNAIKQKKWSKAIEYYEAKARDAERDYALWNFVGDLHLNNSARAQAIEAWRKAVEGYAVEGMHENVVGISKKIVRCAPEEEDLYLQLAMAYLGLEYSADCLASVRSYMKLARQKSESDLRATFKRIIESDISHPHLLQELSTLYRESGVEDIELERRIASFVEARRSAHVHVKNIVEPSDTLERTTTNGEYPTPAKSRPDRVDDSAADLFVLDTADDGADEDKFRPRTAANESIMGAPPPFTSFNMPSEALRGVEVDADALPEGEGKDHYELGVVYREMKLWDAAIREFDQATRDPSLRIRSTLALAGCMQESGDLQGALNLLEGEKDTRHASESERISLHFQLGVIHELLGNLDSALQEFEFVQQQNSSHDEASRRAQALSRKLGRSATR